MHRITENKYAYKFQIYMFFAIAISYWDNYNEFIIQYIILYIDFVDIVDYVFDIKL